MHYSYWIQLCQIYAWVKLYLGFCFHLTVCLAFGSCANMLFALSFFLFLGIELEIPVLSPVAFVWKIFKRPSTVSLQFKEKRSSYTNVCHYFLKHLGTFHTWVRQWRICYHLLSSACKQWIRVQVVFMYFLWRVRQICQSLWTSTASGSTLVRWPTHDPFGYDYLIPCSRTFYK